MKKHNKDIIRLTESQLRNVIKECIKKVLTETYHALHISTQEYVDKLVDYIKLNKATFLNNQQNWFFEQPFDFQFVYDRCNDNRLFIRLYDFNDETTCAFEFKTLTLYINSAILKTEDMDSYKDDIMHELTHFVNDIMDTSNSFYPSYPDESGSFLYYVSLVQYLYDKSEINARLTQLDYVLSKNKNGIIKKSVFQTITVKYLMNRCFKLIEDDKYDNSLRGEINNTASIVIGLYAIKNKLKRRTANKRLTIFDYVEYRDKIKNFTYQQMKNTLYRYYQKQYKRYSNIVNQMLKKYNVSIVE